MKNLTNALTFTFFVLFFPQVSFADDWEYEENVDALHQTDASVAATVIRDGYRNRALLVRCNNGNYEIVIFTNDYISNDTRVSVSWRFDEEPVQSGTWHNSTDGTAIFVPVGFQQDILWSLVQYETFVFQWEDYRGSRYTLEFSLNGSSSAISQLSCTDGQMAGDDMDGDSIENQYDECMGMREVVNGFEDEDGCPDSNSPDGGDNDFNDCVSDCIEMWRVSGSNEPNRMMCVARCQDELPK